LDELKSSGLDDVRVFGGVGCWIHCQETREWFRAERSFDLDLFAVRLDQHRFDKIVKRHGLFRRNRDTYAGGYVLEYVGRGVTEGLSLDLYVGNLIFSHRIPTGLRLAVDWPTLPLAELLATKLQIHDLEFKDALDIMMLIGEHPLGESDEEQINRETLLQMGRRDWGLWYDMVTTLRQVTEAMKSASNVPRELLAVTEGRVGELTGILSHLRGSLKWDLRAFVGTKAQWWNEVEEWRDS